MEINLKQEVTFSQEVDCDLFLFILNAEKNEVASQGLNFDQILELTLEEITNDGERREIMTKVRKSMRKFLKKTKKYEKENRDVED